MRLWSEGSSLASHGGTGAERQRFTAISAAGDLKKILFLNKEAKTIIAGQGSKEFYRKANE